MPPLTPDEAHEIRRLRQRMERELARESHERINIKTGRGGLVDVEFLTQMLQLTYGVHEPRVRVRSTFDALQVLREIGVLLGRRSCLAQRWLSLLASRRECPALAHDRPVEDLDRGRMDLTRGGQAHGVRAVASARLWREYEVRREAIRACYERWFDRAEAACRQLAAPLCIDCLQRFR